MKIFKRLLLLTTFLLSLCTAHARVLTIHISSENPECFGEDGYVTIDSLTTLGATGPYIIEVITPQTFFNVGDTIPFGNGNYTIRVRDLADNTLQFQPFSILEPFELLANPFGISPTCIGDCDGQAAVTPIGGTAPYTYQWNDPSNSTLQVVGGLCAGTYRVTITDGNLCTEVDSVTISDPSPIVPNVTAQDVLCAGDANGKAWVTPSGGTSGNYTNFQWQANPSITDTAFNYAIGTYEVTVTDADGCTGTESFTISDPPPITINAAVSDVFCAGQNNGSINITVNGGTQPYSYNWDNTVFTEDRFNLFAGTYNVTVTDDNGCTATLSRTISEPNPPLTVDSTVVNVSCNGGNDGQINLSISGGIGGPNTINWSAGLSGNPVTNLSAGTYFYTVTNPFGCTVEDSAIVDQPPAIAISNTSTDPSCVGGNDGSITLTVSGGTPPLSFAWGDNGVTTQDRTALTAGIYNLTVTDGNNCTATFSDTLNDPAPILPNVTVTDVLCNGESTGTAIASPSGGSNNYVNYQWTSSLNNTAFELNLSAGTYTVTVTDSDGCTGTETFTVNEPATAVSSSITNQSDVFCFGGNNGFARAQGAGGNSPYTYQWDDPASTTTASVFNLSQGTYFVTVSDANGCTTLDSAIISSPPEIIIDLDSVDVSCNSGNDGSITATVTGGFPGYTFSWSDGTSGSIGASTPFSINTLTAGTYRITVNDIFNCEKIDSIVVNEPTAISISSADINPDCNGASTGSIDLSVTGGTAGYTFLWSPGGATSEDLTGLSAGTYTVVVTDNNGCTQNYSTTLTDPALLTVSIDSSRDVRCNGEANGFARALATGGTGNITYDWSNLAPASDPRANDNLSGGTYTVTATDDNGCTATTSINIREPLDITLSPSAVGASCQGVDDGSATVVATGGTAPYNYLWSNGQTTSTITGLSIGTYRVTVTDDSSCVAVDSVIVTQPSALTLTTSVTNPLCSGENSGTATVTVAGGTGPYNFIWNDPAAQTTATATSLLAGTYDVTVTDNNGCTESASVTLNDPPILNASISASTNPSCNGVNDGSVTVAASGGTSTSGTYTYAWNDPANQTTAVASNLSDGTYTVTVSDDNGCTTTASATINEPSPITLVVDTIIDVDCRGNASGAINISVAGGTAPLTFNWDNGLPSQEDQNNLLAGNYNLTVVDQNNCSINQSFTVNEPAQDLTIVLDSSQSLACNGDGDGFIAISVTGGTPGYSYSWDNGATTQDISALSGGSYTIVVTDTNNCAESQTFTITEPAPLAISQDALTNVSCGGTNDGSATISGLGGSSPYSFAWSNGGTGTTQNNLAIGTYRITITDDSSCTAVDSITISQPQKPDVNLDNQTNVSCNGLSDGSITVSAAGATPPYNFSWSNGSNNSGTTSTISGLSAGSYTVTVSISALCDSVRTFIITEPALLLVGLNVQDEQCSGADDGQITANPTGGTSPYSYTWSDGSPDNPVNSGLAPGFYFVTVTDANGCQVVSSATVQPATPIILTAGGVDADCNGEASGSLAAVALGGAGNFTFSWSDGGTGAIRNNVTAGSYTVTVTDDNNCTQTTNVTIGEPDTLRPNLSLVDESCSGLGNGSATVNITGGTASYDVDWSTGLSETNVTTSSVSNLSSGNYFVSITDDNGCDTVQNFTIGTNNLNLVYTDSVRNDSCFNECDGFISLNIISGGTAPYTFTWTAGVGTGNTASGLCAGSYAVTVSDNLGCDTVINYTITEPTQLVANPAFTEESCSPGSDATASVSPSGGTSPYVVNWSNGVNGSNQITSLTAGSYTATITDANFCSITTNITINQRSLTASGTVSDVSCNGGADGSITQTISGGSGNYTFSWDNGLPPNSDQNSLSARTYNVTITDGTSGCTTSASYTIAEPTAISATLSSSDESCSPGNDGTASVSASGGTVALDYTYAWSNGGNTAIISGLSAGTYRLTITDDNGCSLVDSTTVNQLSSFTLTSSSSDISCNGANDGSINLTVTGATGVPTYSWDNGLPPVQDQLNLSQGIYNVTVTDPATGCDEIRSFTINEPAAIGATFAVTDESCNPGGDGSITVTASGGTVATDYTYSWSGGGTGSTLAGLSGGTYRVTITDDNNCSYVDSATVNSVANFTLLSTTTDISCNGLTDGQIDLTVNGNTGVPTFNWSNGLPATEDQNNLAQGTYSVTVTDPATGCVDSLDITINEPAPLSVSFTVLDESCTTGGDGAITANPSGGTVAGGYTFNWFNGSSSNVVSGLSAGTYRVTITDDNGCTLLDSATVNGGGATILLNETITDATCSGVCDGNISLSPSNGTAPYTFNWDDGSNQFFRANLCAGDYDVTVTDALGCTAVDTFTVNDGFAITATITSIPDTCLAAVGSATASGNGGTAPYTFNWSNFANGPTVTGLLAGNYDVTVTDAGGCSTVETVTIANDATFSINLSITDETCDFSNDGSISVSTIGGNNPITYNWSGPQAISGAFPTNVSAGTYFLTVTDATGCNQLDTAIVSEPNPIAAGLATTPESCFPGSDGTVTITPRGGTAPYQYDWGSGLTSNDFQNGLNAGPYRVTVTDNNGCTERFPFTISSGSAFNINFTTDSASCNGAADGSIDLTVTGGNAPITFNWDNGLPPTEDQSNLVAGNYRVTVSDATPCTEVVNIRINEDSPIDITINTNDESCIPGGDGNAKAVVIGGQAPYTFNWDAGTVFNDSVADLTAGSYAVTVTDNTGCTKAIGYPILPGSNIVANEVVDEPSCFGGTDGSITLNPSGSTNPNPSYTYNWFDGSTLNTISNLSTGVYRVTISDNSTPPCTKVENISVRQPDIIDATVATTVASCNPGGDGTARVGAVLGGTPPYTYSFSAGTATGNTVSGLSPGSYTASVTDSEGCTRPFPFDVNPAPSFSVSLTSTDASCNGGNDGTITVNVTGATNPLTYNWSNGLSGGATPTTVSAGIYTVTVTDGNGCTETAVTTINEAAPIISGLNTIDESCASGGDGSASVNPSNGTPPYTINWSNGASGVNSITNLVSGSYDVTITDATPCSIIETFTISTGQNINVAAVVDSTSCNGVCDGSINLIVTGSTGPYTYQWSDGSNLPSLNNQCAGNYSVTITDATACSNVENYTIEEPDPLVSIVTSTDESCNPSNDGSATAISTGGTSPYSYAWSNGNSGSTINNLSAGSYNVTISDANGCSNIQNFSIGGGVSNLVITQNFIQMPSCPGDADGFIFITVTGNTGTLTYQWDNGLPPFRNAFNLSAGTYSVTATDAANGCTATRSFTLMDPSPIAVTVNTNPVSCFPGNDGSITLIPSGGTVATNYNYQWDNGLPAQATVTGLSAGTYSYTVTDDNGCSFNNSVTLNTIAPFNLDSTITNVSCNGLNDGSIALTVTGSGAAPTYNWSNSLGNAPSVTNLSAGIYFVTVTDPSSGCSETAAISVGEPDSLQASLSSSPESCTPGSDGTITANPSGGTTPYSINWFDGSSLNSVAGLSAGTYRVTLTDGNNCSLVDSITVGSSAPFNLNAGLANPSCNGGNDGSIDLTVSGASGSLTYAWSNGLPPTEDQTNLTAGTYEVTVTESGGGGCTQTQSFTLNDPTAITISINTTPESCNPGRDGFANASASGGTGTLSYAWSSGSNSRTASGLTAGTYTVTVTDANNCSATAQAVVGTSAPFSIDSILTNVSCNGGIDGAINLTINGAGGIPTFNWSNGLPSQEDQTNLLAGTYRVTVTDPNNGCQEVSVFSIDEPNPITASINSTNSDCGLCNGSLNLSGILGGTGNVNITWLDGSKVAIGQTGPTANGLCAGNYFAALEDANNCVDTLSIQLNDNNGPVVTTDSINESCFGANDGQVSVASACITAGNCSVEWRDGSGTVIAVTDTVRNLAPGAYTATITDNTSSCVSSIQVNVSPGGQITPNLTLVNDNCSGLTVCQGYAKANPTGGTAPYTFDWTGPGGPIAGNDSIGSLCAGNYNLTITDNQGCTITESFTINQGNSILPNENIVAETCPGNCDGEISLNPTGGLAPYTYTWSNGAGNVSTLTNLCSGTYSVTIADANSCDTSLTVNISSTQFTYSLSKTDESCLSPCDGTASITVNGPTLGFNFNWSPVPPSGQGTANVSDLCPGKYFVTITSNRGCVAEDSVEILPNAPILPNELSINESCAGACDGSITLNPSGGAGGPFNYNWSPVPPEGQGVSSSTSLCGGTYAITITDVSGCDTSVTLTIQSAGTITSNVVTTDQSCGGPSAICDGTAFVTAIGGQTPYSFAWSTGTVTGLLGDSIVNVCAGNDYTVTITDANGCSLVDTFDIQAPTAITATLTPTSSTCNVCNGSINAVVSGAVSPISYQWLDQGLNPVGTDNASISNLCAGIYFLDVTDANGCVERFSSAVNDIGSEVLSSNSTDVSCFGSCDGTASVSFSCGDPSCSVEWFNATTGNSLGVSSNNITNLCAGDYFVEVTNNSGCKSFEQIRIGGPTQFNITESIVDASCAAACSGSISLSVSGASGGYAYNWAPAPLNGQGSSNISGLCAGTYSVTITDANACDTVLSYTLSEPNQLTASFTTVRATCGQPNGIINASVNGGTVAFDYRYQWFDDANNAIAGATSPTLNNVEAGVYFLDVIDDNNCQELFRATLSSTNGPTISLDSIQDVDCFGSQNGSIEVSISGNNPPFTYNWLPFGQTTEDLNNVGAGDYTLVVTNSLGCVSTDTFTINGPSDLLANISTNDANCGVCDGDASISLSGGTAPYTYLWSNGSQTSTTDSLCAGTHSVQVSDANGCSKTFNFNINANNGPTDAIITATAASCASNCDGTASVQAVGGSAPYTYLWLHNGATTNSLTNLCAGTYTVQITDASGCVRNEIVDISSPNALSLNQTVFGNGCNTFPCIGSIQLDVNGGSAPYAYSWSPAQPNSNFIAGLCAGIYSVTVTDQNGCSISRSFNVSDGDTLTANPTANDVSCFGSCDGSLISNLTASSTLNFQWFDDQGNTVANINSDVTSGVCAGNYVLELTELPSGCKSFVNVSVGEPDSIDIGITVINNISCAGASDASLFVSTTGGSLLFNYSWDDPQQQTELPARGLSAGTYTVTATDANGCSATSSITLNDPPALNINILSSTNVGCSSDCDGTASVDASGGTAPYTYTWSGGQLGSNPISLCFGPNIVTVEDATGCSISDTVFVSATDTVVAQIPNQTVFCDGDSIRLIGSSLGSNVIAVAWYEGTTSNLFTTNLDTTISRPIGTHDFFLIATDGSCADTSLYQIEVVANPTLSIPATARVIDDEVLSLEVMGQDPSFLYNWSPGTDLSDSTIAEPVSSLRENRTYTLTVQDTNGCLFIDSIAVVYIPEIDIPSGFSPNGDGVNDVWDIDLLQEFPEAKVQIYNRWGKLLYEQRNGYVQPWDGRYEGEALPIGTYYFIIDLKAPNVDPITGPITIVK